MAASEDSFAQFTHGDPVAATQLRRALTVIRDHATDPEVARLADRALTGLSTLREVMRHPAMLGALGRGMDAFASQWGQLTPQQRAALAEKGKRDTEVMARVQGLPGDPNPAPVGEFGPADDR